MRYRSQTAVFVCLVATVLSTVGCATPNKQMQAFAQRFRFKPKASDASGPREKSIASINKKRDDVLLDAAIASWSDGNTEETQKLLTQVIERTPQHREARHLMADLLASEQKTDEAKEHLQVVLKADPQDAKAHYAMAMLLQTAGDEETAQKHLTRAKTLDPKLDQLAGGETSISDIAPVSFVEDTEATPTTNRSKKVSLHLGDE